MSTNTCDVLATTVAEEVLPRETAAPMHRNRLRAVATVLQDALLRKGSISVLDQAVVSLAGFATSVIIGRMCGRADLGVYYLALSVILFTRGVQEQLVSSPYMVYASRREGRALHSYSGSVLVHQFALTALIVIVLLGLAALTSTGSGPAQLGPVAWVLVGVAPLMLMREFVRQFAFAHLEIGSALAVDIGVSVLQVAALLALGLTGYLDVTAAFCLIGMACGLASLTWLTCQRGRFQPSPAGVLTDWRHNWNFGRWALASQLIGCASPFFMPWILAVAHGESATGLLGACTALVGLANMFVLGVANFLSPRAARAFADGGVDELRRILSKATTVFVVTLGAFCVVVLVAGEWLAALVYGDKFAGAGTVITVLAIGMLANSLCITAGNGLWAMERPAANFRADVVSLVATLVAAVLLVPPFGVLGAATASTAGVAAGMAIRWLTLTRLMRAFPLTAEGA